MEIIVESKVNFSLDKVFRYIGREFFSEVTPPWIRANIIEFEGINVGNNIKILLNLGRELIWHSKIAEYKKSEYELMFIDVGLSMLPFMNYWHHKHTFKTTEEDQTTVKDIISFSCDFKFMEYIYYAVLFPVFKYRSYAYNNFFKSKVNL